MFKQKRSKKIHNPNNSTTQEFTDTSLDSGVLLDISISYPATPLDASFQPFQPPAILLSDIEEKIFQQQQENDNGSKDPLSLKPEEPAWMESFWDLEKKYLQLSESYKNVLQENLIVQTANIKLEQELELSRKHAADLETRLHGFQSGASIFQKQYFMLQKQNIKLVKKLYELQSTLINVPFTQIDITQQPDSIPTLGEPPQNPQIVCAYESFKHRHRHGNGSKTNSNLTVVPHQHEASQHQQGYDEATSSPPPYKDPPFQHVTIQQQHNQYVPSLHQQGYDEATSSPPPYKDPPFQHVAIQQQHMPYAFSSYQHVSYQADLLPQQEPYKEIEETSVIIQEDVEVATSSNSRDLPYLSAIQYTSDSFNLLRLVKLQYEYSAKHPTAKHPAAKIKYMSK